MTPDQARGFLSRTEWLEMVELALKQPMPDHVRKMREEALAILKGRRLREDLSDSKFRNGRRILEAG